MPLPKFTITYALTKQSAILDQLSFDDHLEYFESLKTPTLYRDKMSAFLQIPYSFKTVDYDPAVKWDSDGNEVPTTGIRKRYTNCVTKFAEILDHDDGTTVEQFAAEYKELEFFLYPSSSHLKDGTTEKFRVILPYASPVPVETVWNKTDAIKEFFNDADETFVARGRGQYVPTITPDSILTSDNYFYIHNTGELLDIDWFDDNPPAPEYKPVQYEAATNETRDVILQKLCDIGVDSYEDFKRVVPAMICEMYSEQDIFNACSRRLGRYSSQALTNQIKDFSNKNGYSQGNMGTLINHIRRSEPTFFKKLSYEERMTDIDKQIATLKAQKEQTNG